MAAKPKLTKQEKAQQALLALFADEAPELIEVAKQKKARQGKIYEISEDEIQEFREAQGITYFLKAPALFHHKECKHCGEHFLVSRLYVAYCSYTCIRKSLNEDGIEWRKGNDIELLTDIVYEGNEPIWIRNLEKLTKALEVLHGNASMDSSLSTVSQSSQENSTSPSTALIKL